MRTVFNRIYAKISGITSFPVAYQINEVYPAGWLYLEIAKIFDGVNLYNPNVGIRVYKGSQFPDNRWIPQLGYTPPADKPYALMNADGVQELPLVNERCQCIIEFYGITPVNPISLEFVAVPFNDR